MAFDGRIRDLLAINRAITGALDHGDVLRLVVEKGAALLGATACVLVLAGPDRRARVAASVGVRPEVRDAFSAPLDEHLQGALCGALGVHPEDRFLGVPVVVRGRVEGVLAVFHRGAEPGADEETLLSALADQAAVALDNAERFEALRRALRAREQAEREQAMLARAWETLASSLDYRETLRRAARLALDLLGDVCTIDLVEKDGSVQRVVALHADPACAALAGALERLVPPPGLRDFFWKVAATRRPQLVADVPAAGILRDATLDEERRRVLDALGIQSLIGVPLVSRGHLLAVLTVASCRPERRHGAGHVRLAEELARRAALAVDNVRLYHESCVQAVIAANLAEGVLMVRASDGTVVYANARLEQIYGYGPGEMLGRPAHTLNAPGQGMPEERAAAISGPLSLAGVWHGEVEGLRRDGARFWCYVSVSGFEHPELGPVWLSVRTDVTERRRLEEENLRQLREKEVLLKEVHHRVKNNLQVISSLFYLQQQHATDPQIRALLDESRTRVHSIALIHEQLYQSTSLAFIDFDRYLRRLTATLLSTYGTGRVEIETDAAGVALDIEHAVPCALLISELVSNSLKHAFAGRPGKVWVRARREGEGRVTLDVGDDGAGIPEGVDWSHTGSLGLQLVQGLGRQLRASIELDRTAGTRFTIRFDAP